MKSLKEKFGTFEMTKDKVKNTRGGNEGFVQGCGHDEDSGCGGSGDGWNPCKRICANGGCRKMWGNDTNGYIACYDTCRC